MFQLAAGHGQVIDRKDLLGLPVPGADRAGVALGLDGVGAEILAALPAVDGRVVEPEADGGEDFFFVSSSRSELKRSMSLVT